MGTTARSRLMTFLPWIALIAVTIFAFAQMRARRSEPARPAAAPASVAGTVPRAATTAPGRAAPGQAAPGQADPATAKAAREAALRAADTALDDALQDLARARARIQELERVYGAATTRADTAQARLDAATARLDAAETDLDVSVAEVKRLETELGPLLERVVALEERRAIVEDRLLRMLADAVAEDPERTKRARGVAGRLDSDDLERLAVLVREDPTRASVAADLLPAVPSSTGGADALVTAVLAGLEPGDDDHERLARLGRDHLVRPSLLTHVLGEAELGRWHPILLAWLGRHASALEEEARDALAHPLASRLLGDDDAMRALALRLMGILRQDGQATALAPFLGAEDDAVRAAAAYALSRAPDRAAVETVAWAAVPALLADESLDVRVAGALLAEAILGRPLAFDPAADPATRSTQIQALPAKP